MLSLKLSRVYPNMYINTVDPGWVATKMANYNAPDNLKLQDELINKLEQIQKEYL